MQKFLLWSAPGIFVLLWSTGFIGARLGLPYSEPFSFLFWRYSIVLLLLAPVVAFSVWVTYTADFAPARLRLFSASFEPHRCNYTGRTSLSARLCFLPWAAPT